MSKSIRIRQKKAKERERKRGELNRIRIKQGKSPKGTIKGRKRKTFEIPRSKYGYRQGTIITGEEKTEIERLTGFAAICGWLRYYGRIPSGKVSGICALSENFGKSGSYENIHRCKDNTPMRDHNICDVYRYFMRTLDSPYRLPFFIYPNNDGSHGMRFNWEGREVAGRLLLGGKKNPKINGMWVSGFCEDVRLEKGKLVEEIVPADFGEGLALRVYLSQNRDNIYEGMRHLLTPQRYHALREQKALGMTSFAYQDGNNYRLRFEWKGKEIVCTVYLGGRKNLHLDRIVVDGICEKMEVSDGKIIENIVPVKKEERWGLKRFLWDPPEHVYEGLKAILPSKSYEFLRHGNTLKHRIYCRYRHVA